MYQVSLFRYYLSKCESGNFVAGVKTRAAPCGHSTQIHGAPPRGALRVSFVELRLGLGLVTRSLIERKVGG